MSSGSPFEKTAGYSRALVQGDWCFVSGTTGYDYATMTMPQTVEEQTRNCLKTIEKALTDEGPQTRLQLRERLEGAGIPAAGQILIHLLFLVAVRGIAVRGPMVGKSKRWSCETFGAFTSTPPTPPIWRVRSSATRSSILSVPSTPSIAST